MRTETVRQECQVAVDCLPSVAQDDKKKAKKLKILGSLGLSPAYLVALKHFVLCASVLSVAVRKMEKKAKKEARDTVQNLLTH